MNAVTVGLQALGAGVPVVLALRLVFTEVAERRRVWVTNAERQRSGAVRKAGDRSAGVGRIRARVVGDGPVSLGSSIEQAENLRGAPTLDSSEVIVEDEHGQRYRIPKGASLEVCKLGGARRNLLESVTRESGGVDQRFSFEVDPDTTFLLQATFPRSEGEVPFRGAPIELAGPLKINPSLDVEPSQVGCVAYPALGAGIFGALYPTSTFGQIAGWGVWVIAVLFSLVSIAVSKGHASPDETARE